MNPLGERIKELRERQGLRLIDIADACGVKEATAQRWESGNIKTVKHEHILAIAAALHCSPAYLMGWEELPQVCDIVESCQEKELNKMVEKLLRLDEGDRILLDGILETMLKADKYLKRASDKAM